MKHLLILSLLGLSFFACEKNEIATLAELRSQAAIWKLESFVYSPGSGLETILLDSERTLQFWEGEIWTNGSICALDGPVGPTESISYVVGTTAFSLRLCPEDSLTQGPDFQFLVDLEAGVLSVGNTSCIEGCAYLYRRQDD